MEVIRTRTTVDSFADTVANQAPFPVHESRHRSADSGTLSGLVTSWCSGDMAKSTAK